VFANNKIDIILLCDVTLQCWCTVGVW